jgi:alpha-beta hydrolase superfamily lysophospholipase
MPTEELTFFSGPGLRLAARLYVPDTPVDRKTGIVFCHGFGGVKEGTPPGLSTRLAQHGYSVLTFDYRGFGASEGSRGLLNPAEQIEDAVHAVEFLARRSGIDRVGVYGTSFGGGIAVGAARRNPRVRCGVVTVPVVSGRLWLQSIMRWYEFQQVLSRAMEAIGSKTQTGEIEMADRFDIMIPDPLSQSLYQQPFPMAVETFFHVLNHDPLADAPALDRPFAVIGVEDDPLVPAQQAKDLFDNLGGPKELTVFQGTNHYAVYEDLLEKVFEKAAAWFDAHLKREE